MQSTKNWLQSFWKVITKHWRATLRNISARKTQWPVSLAGIVACMIWARWPVSSSYAQLIQHLVKSCSLPYSYMFSCLQVCESWCITIVVFPQQHAMFMSTVTMPTHTYPQMCEGEHLASCSSIHWVPESSKGTCMVVFIPTSSCFTRVLQIGATYTYMFGCITLIHSMGPCTHTTHASCCVWCGTLQPCQP